MMKNKGSSATGGKAFAFLSGVIVGTLVASLMVVNLYASSAIQGSVLSEQHQQHKELEFHTKQQQLRIEKSSSFDVQNGNDADTSRSIGLKKTYNKSSNSNDNDRLEAPKLLSLPSQLHAKDNTTARPSYKKPSFLEFARETGTDKVKGVAYLPSCLEDDLTCTRPSCERKKCRPWGHFYHTMYQQKLSAFLDPDDSFQLVEIGYNLGFGYDTYKKFFAGVPGAELHTIEISCIEQGPREEGKWPWANFAKENKEYESLLARNLLHCGDASNVEWLHQIWNEHIYRGNRLIEGSTSDKSPPLKIVVDDGSHLANHMVHSVFFWLPRIEPGGILIIEDVQPIDEANLFRTQFLPQVMADLHFCGDPNQKKDEACFPQIYPLLQSIHCEMHICVLERNDEPAVPDLSIGNSKPPPNALDMSQCYTFANSFGAGMEAK
mmetsp:Transcript_3968/g.8542  ORF Transcript_3968/g.8542 Transcript_3968/m.8542 type:complete len:435 (-) Transcript_3968:1822-3126(-)